MPTDKRTKRKILKYEEMLSYERLAWEQGFRVIASIDEAGRGPLAGPVVAAACILNPDKRILGLNDSKKMTPSSRKRIYQLIVEDAVDWQVGQIDHETIDEINILQATCEAMRMAVNKLRVEPQLLLIDVVKLEGVNQPIWPIVRGDALLVSIAAASILAKVTRDQIMEEYDLIYPEYGFAQHKGYGTARHCEALKKYGPCPIHRKTFIRSILGTD
ncbi:MAG: ribonuclease HII [Clostridiaceae bacterium]|nr:ribonuclease HII [Clostridiaceae bacterium]